MSIWLNGQLIQPDPILPKVANRGKLTLGRSDKSILEAERNDVAATIKRIAGYSDSSVGEAKMDGSDDVAATIKRIAGYSDSSVSEAKEDGKDDVAATINRIAGYSHPAKDR